MFLALLFVAHAVLTVLVVLGTLRRRTDWKMEFLLVGVLLTLGVTMYFAGSWGFGFLFGGGGVWRLVLLAVRVRQEHEITRNLAKLDQLRARLRELGQEF